MKKLIAVTLVLLFTISIQASEERDTKVVYELFETAKMSTVYQQTIEKMIETQTQQNPELIPIKDTMLKFLDKYMGWESIKKDMAKIYMRHFTDDELKELIAFYKTPIGQKTAILTPVLTAEGAKFGQQRVEEHKAEFTQMILDKLKEKK
jgi:uncharacterized protein